MPTTARTAEARSNILFDRFFARVFSSNQPVDASWVVVGSVALAKHLGAHRRINDVDIDYLRGDLPDAVRELTARLREPNPDGLEYSIFEQFHAELRVGRASSILVDSDGVNIKDFRIDLGVKSALTQPPVWKESPFIPEAEFGYRGALVAHPVDLLSGKVMAIFKSPYTSKGHPRPSEKPKNMIDAMAMEQQLEIDAGMLAESLRIKADAEGVDLDDLNVTDLESLRRGFNQKAVESPRLAVMLPQFDQGYDSLRLMCRLALSGAEGTWNPRTRLFHPEPRPAAPWRATPRGSPHVRLADINPAIARMSKRLPYPVGDPYGPPQPSSPSRQAFRS